MSFDPQQYAENIAQQFTEFLNEIHSAPEIYDDELDAQIHRWYADIKVDGSRNIFPPRDKQYFSPSSANAEPRGLYEKLRGARRDQSGQAPFQGRWTRLGTAIGDMIQRDLLFAEKHYGKISGQSGAQVPFRFERNEHGEPVFEEFAKKNHAMDFGGQRFSLFGTCDGIMRYADPETGEVIRVGLEIKSKQTTSAMTSGFSTRKGPKQDHVDQCIVYSEMYGVDYYVLLYVNASKKSWNMTEEDFAKTPDIAAFGLHITEEMRNDKMSFFAEMVHRAKTGNPPKLDLGKWTFHNFKSTVARSLSDEEVRELARINNAMQHSGIKDADKRELQAAFDEIITLRGGVA